MTFFIIGKDETFNKVSNYLVIICRALGFHCVLHQGC